jgi:DMSO reductase family type II enzyme chaperone
MTPLERSAVYAGFAAAFRDPRGGADVLDPALVPPPPDNADKAFIDAFDPSVSKQAVSLHASAHTSRDQTDLYQELIRFYDHFGLKRRDGGELPDHLAVLLEFMHFLTAQEQANRQDEAAVHALHTAQADFIDRHLAPLTAALSEKSQSPEPRYRQLPAALSAFLEDELSALAAQRPT